MKVYKCDRCGKVYTEKPLYYDKQKNTCIIGIGIKIAEKCFDEFQSIDLCEDCLKKFIEFVKNKS